MSRQRSAQDLSVSRSLNLAMCLDGRIERQRATIPENPRSPPKDAARSQTVQLFDDKGMI
jgi:hypothetical protein